MAFSSMVCSLFLQSWVWFSQRVSSQNDELVASLRTLIQPAIVALCDEALYEVAVELLADILSNYSGFLTESHYESLFSLFETQWSHARYRRLVEGDFDFDSIQYGQLMISLGDSKVQSLIYSVDNRSSNFLARLRGLLSAQGYLVSEDKIFVPALEFWSTYVETLTDCIYSDSESKAWVSSATSHVLEAVSTVWRRVAYPPPNVLASWDSADRAGFGDARKDVADLLQSTFTVTGPPLISTFANLTLQSMSSNSWPELEAAAFCLGSLAECVSGDAGCDDTLRAATFVSLKDTDKGAQETIDHAVAQLGPMIARSIVQNIGGNASRSELDRLGEPLKKMVSNQVKARAWLEQALFDPSFPGQHISREEKAVFLKKIIK
ncbi:hypothetical protein CcaCcLH18_10059 [Colletotrichum camelliae]|nr:hypothetical protein CcaCcLH18_10059 [Colletotrichum camelliae]